MKLCVGCNECKPPSAFYPIASSPDGLGRYCKWCSKVNRALESLRKRDKKKGISNRQIDRAKRLGIEFEDDLLLANVFKRDKGICHLCGEWVQPRYASPDHVLPLSKGGTHTFDNVRLSHLKCNLRKGNRV